MLSSYSKMHIFQPSPDKIFIIMTAGNLATTQAIVNRLESDLEETENFSLRSCMKMNEAARYVSNVSREEQAAAQNSVNARSIDTSASLLLGGQIKGADPTIYMIYSASNFITDSDKTPFLQIGESKYGKPILDRILTRDTPLEDAARCAIVSMDSTIKSNATVGPPIEVLVYKRDTFESNHHIKFDEDDQYLRDIKQSWNEALNAAFLSLPRFDWESHSTTPPLQQVVNNNINDQQHKPSG